MSKTVLMMTEDNLTGREYLNAILRSECELQAVVVEVSKSAKKFEEYSLNRMGGLYEPPQFASLLGNRRVPVYYVKKHTNRSCIQLLTDLSPEIIVAGGVGGILKNNVLSISKYFVGCHPGYLPVVRGSDVVAHAIVYNHPIGATCFLMNEGIDTGPIIYKEKLPVFPGDTYEVLEALMMPHCGKVLQKGLELLLNGVETVEQTGLEVPAYRTNKVIVDRCRIILADRSYTGNKT